MPPFRIVADHPGEKGVVHVGEVYSTLEDAEAALAFDYDELEAAMTPTPGGPGADERVVADAVLHAAAAGHKLSIVELVPSKKGKDDAGQEVAVESKWKKVG